ncbi:XVIPCD domain-containing protein [Pseudoxanthomonas sp.]|uniref:XVIPCD domain-containing protein n=1 Tax=Pseudoxanthomonas sp. TaxID=1871049 RepID=UPI00261720A4|nr:XVIPCD domain-containing protein [Pseudoxanthomonas sp.]WDS36362.1 MAG: DUF2974 domain-containing protein [Pseudoxanthomonas sp.]
MPDETTKSFAEEIQGKEPKDLDLQLPSLLQDLYATADQRRNEPASARALPADWSRLDDDALHEAGIDPLMLHDAESGFDAALYKNSQGQVVLAMCGTDELKDWRSNFGQGLGIETAQYDRALQLTHKAQEAFGKNMILAGHSLGGGLAAASAMVYDVPAVTYNAAGVNDRTLEREGLDPTAAKDYAKDGLIRAYHVKNEILTHLQEDSFPIKYVMPDAAGHQIELPDPDPLSMLERLVPGKMLMHRLDLHGIESVMESQSLQQLRQHDAPGQPARLQHADDPANALLRDALDKLGTQRERLGLQDDAKFINAAAGLAAHAGADGLSRIDHLVPDGRGNGVFAVQGRLDDPAHHRSHVDANQAAQVPADQSAQQLRAQSQTLAVQQQDQEQQQRQAPRAAMA